MTEENNIDNRDCLQIVMNTDVGRLRQHNEDKVEIDTKLGLAVLADGMGGHKAGEIASSLAVGTTMEHIRHELEDIDPNAVCTESGRTHGSIIMRKAIQMANHTISHTAATQPLFQGMGTTIVALLYYHNRLSVGHVGDSRLYRLRDGQFEQLTTDHSLVQDMLNKGYINQEEAKSSAHKNLVTRALGIESSVEVDIQEFDTIPGDIYLLCSDGLSDMISDDHIKNITSKHQNNLDKASTELIKQANYAGGEDNISVILVKIVCSSGQSGGWIKRMLSK